MTIHNILSFIAETKVWYLYLHALTPVRDAFRRSQEGGYSIKALHNISVVCNAKQRSISSLSHFVSTLLYIHKLSLDWSNYNGSLQLSFGGRSKQCLLFLAPIVVSALPCIHRKIIKLLKLSWLSIAIFRWEL